MLKHEKKSGGANRGQGRKNKFGEPTVILHIRVPASKQAELKERFKKLVEPYKTIKT